MGKSPKVSVIIPIYGTFDLNRAKISVDSVLLQKDIKYEVIVSEQGEISQFPDISGVKHIFNYHKPQKDLSNFNPGKVRNLAAKEAKGEFIYTKDADVLFLDNYHLAKSIELISRFPNQVFYRPLMRRFPLDEFDQFKASIDKIGLEKTINSLDLSQDYIATLSGKIRKIRIFKKESIYPKIFTAFEEDFQTYIGNSSFKGCEPMFWNENRQCGINLVRMEHFENVGGYSESFINWGCEDSDLQWKLSESYDLRFFPENFEVLHLDHPKGYFSQEMWKKNEEISAIRVKQGLVKSIKIDKRNKLWQKK